MILDTVSFLVTDPLSTNLTVNRLLPTTVFSFTVQSSATTLTALLISSSIFLEPPAGYAVHNITDISQASDPACIYYGLPVSIGQQILHKTTTENAAAVTITSQGFVQVA